MTTDKDFWELLIAAPTDSHTRLIFADWLQEQDDDRAEGMRALGLIGWVPLQTPGGTWVVGIKWASEPDKPDPDSYGRCRLPHWWWNAITPTTHTDRWWHYYTKQIEAEWAAALAFKFAPVWEKEQLLKGVTV